VPPIRINFCEPPNDAFPLDENENENENDGGKRQDARIDTTRQRNDITLHLLWKKRREIRSLLRYSAGSREAKIARFGSAECRGAFPPFAMHSVTGTRHARECKRAKLTARN